MAKALCIRLGLIWLCTVLARMRGSQPRKAWYNDKHVIISAFNDTISGKDVNMVCLISSGRSTREFEGGGDIAVRNFQQNLPENKSNNVPVLGGRRITGLSTWREATYLYTLVAESRLANSG